MAKNSYYILAGIGTALIAGICLLFDRKKKKKEEERPAPSPESWNMDEQLKELAKKIAGDETVHAILAGPVVGTLFLKKDDVLSHKIHVLVLSCTGTFTFVKEGEGHVFGKETTNTYFRKSLKELWDMNVPMSEIDPEKSEQVIRCGYREKIGPPKPGRVIVKIYY